MPQPKTILQFPKKTNEAQASKRAGERRMTHGELLGGDYALIVYDDDSIGITRTRRPFAGVALSATEAHALRDMLIARLGKSEQAEGSEGKP